MNNTKVTLAPLEAEDREQFAAIIRELYLRQPANGIAFDVRSAVEIARELGYPVLVRPSYVLGGRGMQKCNIEADLLRYMDKALSASDRTVIVDEAHPILIDRNLSPIDSLKASIEIVKANVGQVILVWLVAGLIAAAGILACGVGVLVSGPVASLMLVYTYRRLSGGQVAPLTP